MYFKNFKSCYQIIPCYRNSLWGKLGQRANMVQTKLCSEYDQYHSLIRDPKIKIKGTVMVTENVLIVNYKFIEDEYAKVKNTSTAIAAYVTAYARLKLYKVMEEIENNAPKSILYFDTDSIFHVCSSESFKPATGDFLGEFTDEVKYLTKNKTWLNI